MAITINSTVNPSVDPDENSIQPSAPEKAASVNVDLDDSCPNAGAGNSGYSLAASFDGAVVCPSPFVPHYDGSALRWFRVEDQGGVAKLRAYTSANGAPSTEAANEDDLSGHTGLEVMFIYK